jgi:hydroxymethylpyrimidine/phosphomethylpyrimidine kinase
VTVPAPAYPVAMTVASTDSGGGAGVAADLRTFHALGVFGTCAVAATTAQNTVGVHAIDELPPRALVDQIDAVVGDIPVAAAKTGALPSVGLLAAAAAALRRHGVSRLVVDPVAISKHGDPLLPTDAVTTLREELLPLAEVVTPNLHETELLTGIRVTDRRDQRRAAGVLLGFGPTWVLLKGGHLAGGQAVDLLTDGSDEIELVGERIDNRHTHGTGCTLSAALAAYRAHGLDVPTAARRAKEFVTGAIRHGFPLGHGIGPVDVMWQAREGSPGR